MTLQKLTESLPAEKQFELALQLAKHSLSIWKKFVVHNKLTYHDSIVGLKHVVDKNLLEGTLVAIEIYLAAKTIKKEFNDQDVLLELNKQFEDPIVALQDDDWELPDEVLKTFYAVYNLLHATIGIKKTAFDENTVYVSINQSIDALENSGLLTFEEINSIIDQIKLND